ncbi:MAG: bifunctional nuclease family protein [Spirochaetaceae bacterium]|nr:MAG: bifunctional nuclease family protein [Spirochaetaceae bacterium]
MVELHIKGFFLDHDRMPVAVLSDAMGQRVLPVWIGPSEASSIIVELEEIKSPRPLAHDILAKYFHRHGFTMDALEIYGQSGEFGYNARIKYHRRLRHFDMEVRPSDGLALAVRLKAPLLAEEHLLSSAESCTFLSSLQDPCKGLIFHPPESASQLVRKPQDSNTTIPATHHPSN